MNTPLEALERLKDRDHVVPLETARLVDQLDLDALISLLESQAERLREVEGALQEIALATVTVGPMTDSASADEYAIRAVNARARAALTQPPAMEKTDD